MNALNRLIVVLGSLILIIIVAAIIVLAWGYSTESIERMGDLVEYVDAHENNTSRLVLTLGGAILMVVALIVLLLELSPGPSRTVEIGEVEGGKAFLSTDAIAHQLEQLVNGVEGVISSRAKVTSRGKAVVAVLNLQVDPEEDIAAIADRASALARDALTQRMKVKLAEAPRIHITYVERAGARPAAARPMAPPPSAGTAAVAEPEPEERVGEGKEEV